MEQRVRDLVQVLGHRPIPFPTLCSILGVTADSAEGEALEKVISSDDSPYASFLAYDKEEGTVQRAGRRQGHPSRFATADAEDMLDDNDEEEEEEEHRHTSQQDMRGGSSGRGTTLAALSSKPPRASAAMQMRGYHSDNAALFPLSDTGMGHHHSRGGLSRSFTPHMRNASSGGAPRRRHAGIRNKPGQRLRDLLNTSDVEEQHLTYGRVGRVGYVCVADELRLDQLELVYRAQGYYTKFDLGVLHVRCADTAGPSPSPSALRGSEKPLSSSGYGAAEERTETSRLPPGAGGESGSAATAPYNSAGFDLFVFDYGAAVWWGFDQRHFRLVERDFLLPGSAIEPYMINRYPTQLVNENYPVWCTYNVVPKETLEADEDFKARLCFDHFLIPYGRGDASSCGVSMLCASHALAQSSKIDYLELKVQELTEQCSPLPRELRTKGTVTITERRLLQLRGEVLSYRLMLKSGSDLLDEPDFFWENGHLKPVFQATKEEFEISERVRVLDNKLDAANEILAMLAEDFSQRHGARLEWIVIWLVFVEVIIGVLELLVDVRPQWMWK